MTLDFQVDIEYLRTLIDFERVPRVLSTLVQVGNVVDGEYANAYVGVAKQYGGSTKRAGASRLEDALQAAQKRVNPLGTSTALKTAQHIDLSLVGLDLCFLSSAPVFNHESGLSDHRELRSGATRSRCASKSASRCSPWFDFRRSSCPTVRSTIQRDFQTTAETRSPRRPKACVAEGRLANGT